jgi:protease-4
VLLRLLLSPFVLLLRLILWPLRARRRARAAPIGGLVEVRLHGTVREGPPRPRRLGGLSGLRSLISPRRPQPQVHLRALRQLFDEVAADPRVAGVLLTIDGIGGGWASLDALRTEILRLRTRGRRIVAWLPRGAGNKELFVASAAETLVAPPTTDVALVGIKAEAHYLRRALDRLGIDVELHARSEFKSAGDRLAREGRSDADRLQTEILVGAFDKAITTAIAEGRGVAVETVRAWIDDGPTHARRALERGMIDRIAHDDDLPTLLGAEIVAAGRYAARRGIGRRAFLRRPRRRIGIVEVHGAITGRASPLADAMGPVAAEARVLADLRSAERDPAIAAVVVDIDSPGGTIPASDAIGAAVARLAKRKPVVARMADVAASGGYWIAACAPTIVARPLTVTGSIGVVAVRPILARLADRIGIVRDVVAAGRFADLDAITRAPRDDERALFAREIDDHYAAFVAHVARGRRRADAEIEPLARGRVWTGTDARERGLVDRLGGLDEALELLRAQLGAIPLEAEPIVVVGAPKAARDPRPATPDERPAASSLAAELAALMPSSLRVRVAPWVAILEAHAACAVLALDDLPS